MSKRKDSSSYGRGSADARAVAKGLKQKELEDNTMGCYGFLALVAAAAVGAYTHWMVGVILFIVFIIIICKWYYKELEVIEMRRLMIAMGILMMFLAGCCGGDSSYDREGRERIEKIKGTTESGRPAFNYALPGEFWVIECENVALMKNPNIPASNADFAKECVLVIQPGDIVEIISSKGIMERYLRVRLYRNGKFLDGGWILANVPKKAHIVSGP